MASKLKEALFYTLHIRWLSDYKVLAVTTEKNYQYFGRYVDDNSATHARKSECKGRFPTAEAAQECIAAVKAVREAHRPDIKAARAAVAEAEQAEYREIEAVLKGAWLDG